ncbi:hypothetical protein [Mycoavidus cysteinexigens]|uniref:hypothetical protein n=1 Tax=Mycoavidus cysteinexigens TaxID=1553431 RepID=UPI001375E96B|nr:hypothetical protein [Mycoavidus cysteinexigens]
MKTVTVTFTPTEFHKTLWHIAAKIWICIIIWRLPELIKAVCSVACQYIQATH